LRSGSLMIAVNGRSVQSLSSLSAVPAGLGGARSRCLPSLAKALFSWATGPHQHWSL